MSIECGASEKASIEIPGQGAPFYELVRDLSDPNVVGSEANEVVQEVFEEVQQATGIDVEAAAREMAEGKLVTPSIAQVVLYAAGYAGGRVLFKKGVKAEYYRGHSASAMVAAGLAGVIAVHEGAKLMQRRGEHMAEAAHNNPGTVAVTDLSLEKLAEICKACGVYMANLNSPVQTMISGRVPNIVQARKMIKSLGSRATIFRDWSQGPVHTPFFQEAEDRYRADLAVPEVSDPQAGFVRNIDGEITNDAESIREDLGGIAQQVNWTKGGLALLASGVRRFVEISPKSRKITSGLAQDLSPDHEIQTGHLFDYL
ncbi:MAG TPA: acyltransferase domain-containing protein [Candidatus Saccharimonadales bacterium]|nr:acyltransferase domain-containing protein [Candidatus Saccharimonadales bacterium]